MGGSCGNKSLQTINEPSENKKDFNNKMLKKNTLLTSKTSNLSCYKLFQYRNESFYLNTNTLIYTSYENNNNDFNILDDKYNEITRSNIFKIHGSAFGYSKGNKIDSNIQDKFFYLLDGNIEIFCVVDGHGPYGNILAQNIQDKIFKVFFNFLY